MRTVSKFTVYQSLMWHILWLLKIYIPFIRAKYQLCNQMANVYISLKFSSVVFYQFLTTAAAAKWISRSTMCKVCITDNINTACFKHYVTTQAMRLMIVTMATASAGIPQLRESLDLETGRHLGSKWYVVIGSQLWCLEPKWLVQQSSFLCI